MPSVRSSGVEIHYEVSGEGPPVILGHSLLCSGEMWRHQVPALARRHRVVNVDARGHGASGHITSRFTLYDSLADHLAVLDALGIERAVWVGLSQGAMVALRAALTAPQRVSGLVLLDTDAGRETLGTVLKDSLLGVIARTVGVRPVKAQVAKIMFARTTLRENPALVAEWGERFAALHVPSILHALAAVTGRDDLLPRLGRISAPTLVMVGAEDAAQPPARARRLAAAIPGARLVEIPRAGHLSAIEQPEAVTAELVGFLEGLGRGAQAAPAPAPA